MEQFISFLAMESLLSHWDGYNFNGLQELGDFTGLAFADGVLYPSWADSSNSTGDNPNGARSMFDVYTAAVRPNNVPPTVTVDPASGAEGASIALNGSATDPDGDPLTFSWTVTPLVADPGAACAITNATSLAPTIQCSDDGTYTATLTATGDASGPVSASNTVTVSNEAPSVSSATATPSTIDEGQSTAFTADFSDPGWNDTYTASIDWGFGPSEAVAATVSTNGSAGVPDSGAIGGSHTYQDDGSFTVTGTVSDDDGGVGSDDAVVTVVNVNPTAAIDETGSLLINGAPTIITNAGSPVNFSGRSTDPGSDDLTLKWNWDDGPPSPDVTVISLADPPTPDADPSPDVRQQAFLTATVTRDVGTEGVRALRDAYARRADPRNGLGARGAVFAAENILIRGAGPVREEALRFLGEIARDPSASLADRRTALGRLRPHVPPESIADLAGLDLESDVQAGK